MNEKLEQQFNKFIDRLAIKESLAEGVPPSMFDLERVAQHFYNLALADVKEAILEWYNTRTTPHCVAEGDIVAPMREGYKRVIDFIDNLTK